MPPWSRSSCTHSARRARARSTWPREHARQPGYVSQTGTGITDLLTDPGIGHRHIHITLRPGETPVYVEFPTPPLDAEEVSTVELAEGVVASIISLTDLVVDRLKQATYGTDVTRDAAIALIAATYEELDWDAINRRIASQDDGLLKLAERAATIRRAVVSALRQRP